MIEKKFRAWDKKRNCWYGIDDPYSLKFYGFHIWGECTLLCPPNIDDIQYLEVTQFTGLLDKNGVEIYEGDILFWEFEGDSICRAFEVKGAVEWGEVDCEYGNQTIFTWRIDRDHAASDTYEIIGNIYENPELIE